MKTFSKFFEEIKPPEPQEEDPGIKSKEKRQMQIKKQVLLKKMQAVRAGAGADIVKKKGDTSKCDDRYAYESKLCNDVAEYYELNETDIADIIARLEKKRISKGGDAKESPLPAMRKYHADKKKK